MADEGSPTGGTAVYELLPEDAVQKIIDATFQLMRETGVAFDPDPRVLDRFSDTGCGPAPCVSPPVFRAPVSAGSLGHQHCGLQPKG